MTVQPALTTGRRDDPPVAEPRTAASPRRLPGSTGITRHLTMRNPACTGPDLSAEPQPHEVAAAALADELVHDILCGGFPATLDAQATTIAHHLQRALSRRVGKGLERRGPMIAAAAGRHHLVWQHPAALTFTPRNHLRKWYGELCDDLDDLERGDLDYDLDDLERGDLDYDLDDLEHSDLDHDLDFDDDRARTQHHRGTAARAQRPGFDVSFIRRPRMAWSHPDGPGSGLLLDRIYLGAREGMAVRDAWLAAKVAADLRDAATFLAPLADLTGDPGAPARALLGVRVMSHRAANDGVHFLPTFHRVVDDNGHDRFVPLVGAHHPIGGCENCAATTRLPLATPTSYGIRMDVTNYFNRDNVDDDIDDEHRYDDGDSDGMRPVKNAGTTTTKNNTTKNSMKKNSKTTIRNSEYGTPATGSNGVSLVKARTDKDGRRCAAGTSTNVVSA